jgi:hypothetical protein
MVKVTNLYDNSQYSLDGSEQEIKSFLAFRFDCCYGRNLADDLRALARSSVYDVQTDVPLEDPKPMAKVEYQDPSGDTFPKDTQHREKYAKHIYEQLPLNKRNALRMLMQACELGVDHPYYYSMMVNKPFDYIRSEPFRDMIHGALELEGHDAERMHKQMAESTNMIRDYAKNSVFDSVSGNFHQTSSLNFRKSEDGKDSFSRPVEGQFIDSIISFGSKHITDGDKRRESDVVEDMLGANHRFHELLEAAKFVSGRKEIPLDRIRYSFVHHEDDPEAAALYACGLEDTQQNRDSIKAISKMVDVVKFEPVAEMPKSIEAFDPEDKDVADEVKNAYKHGAVEHISLQGKHSKGTLVARDPRTMHVWLIKPGSGSTSPAAGVRDETASQSAREACFSNVARQWGLGHNCIRAEMLKVDGVEWAALSMLPYDYKNADKWKKENLSLLQRSLDSLRSQGTLHKLAILDFVLGNPDRHAQNVMMNPEGHVVMIDHGSAFAGANFAPASDKKSFIPFYLRYMALNFSQLSYEEKLRKMPRTGFGGQNEIESMIARIDPQEMSDTISKYGIDPQPSLERMAIVKGLTNSNDPSTPIDEHVNRLWLNS